MFVSCIAGDKHFMCRSRRMTVGPVDGGRRRESESAGLGDRFRGGLQPQLAQIRAFCVRVKIFSLQSSLEEHMWIRLKGKRKLEVAISAQSA